MIDANQLTLENLRASYRELHDLGRLIVPKGVLRELSSEQLDDIAACAEIEGPDRAIERYFRAAFGGTCPRFPGGAQELVARHPALATKIAQFIFPHTCPDFVDSADWRRFSSERTQHRRIVTVEVLRAAWADFKSRARTTPPPTASAEVPRIEDMTDEEVSGALSKARRDHAFFRNPLATPR